MMQYLPSTRKLPLIPSRWTKRCARAVTASFTIDAGGTGVMYQWRKGNVPLTDGTLADGTIISGATTATLSLSNVTTADAATNYNVVLTSPGGLCPGANSTNVKLVVNPIPTVNTVSNKTVCNNSPSGAISFSGNVSGAVYNWTNDNTSIGLGGSGNGNISSFTATNSGNAPAVANLEVTPSYTNGGTTCTGSSVPFTITVNPTATVNHVDDQVVCNGVATNSVSFSGNTSGGTVVYNWTNNKTSIGLAASGSGDIPSFTAVNNTASPVVATITVTPSFTNGVSCSGASATFTITVNPTPKLSTSLTPPAICNNSTFSYSPASATGGVTFNWSRAAITGISNAAASGTGNPNETLVNTTANPVSVVYVYTLSANGCPYTQNVTVTVNPTPTLSSTLTPSPVCSNSAFIYNPASATTGAVLSWSRAAVSGISNGASSGTGSVNETLVNTTGSPVNVTYVYTLSANGCNNTQNVVGNC